FWQLAHRQRSDRTRPCPGACDARDHLKVTVDSAPNLLYWLYLMVSFMWMGPFRNGSTSSPMVAAGNQCVPSMRLRMVVKRGNRFSDLVLRCWGTARPCMRITEKSSWVAHRKPSKRR